MSTNLDSPRSYLTRIRHLPLLADERALCSFASKHGVIPEPVGTGRLLVATNRRIVSFAGGREGDETFLAPIKECAGVTVDAGSGGGVSFVQGLATIAVGLLVYIVVSYWLTGHVTGPSVPFINIDLGPLVVLFAVLGGVWLAAKQYFRREQGAITLHGSNWTLSFPFAGSGPEGDVFRLINVVFAARDAWRQPGPAEGSGTDGPQAQGAPQEPLTQR